MDRNYSLGSAVLAERINNTYLDRILCGSAAFRVARAKGQLPVCTLGLRIGNFKKLLGDRRLFLKKELLCCICVLRSESHRRFVGRRDLLEIEVCVSHPAEDQRHARFQTDEF